MFRGLFVVFVLFFSLCSGVDSLRVPFGLSGGKPYYLLRFSEYEKDGDLESLRFYLSIADENPVFLKLVPGCFFSWRIELFRLEKIIFDNDHFEFVDLGSPFPLTPGGLPVVCNQYSSPYYGSFIFSIRFGPFMKAKLDETSLYRIKVDAYQLRDGVFELSTILCSDPFFVRVEGEQREVMSWEHGVFDEPGNDFGRQILPVSNERFEAFETLINRLKDQGYGRGQT